MGKIRQTAILLGIAIAAAGAGAWLHLRSVDGDAAKKTGGSDAKLESLRNAALPDLDGVSRRLTDWEGKILVVNFWAAWCEPCREEIPEFVRIQKELGGNGVQFIGIAVEPPDRLKQVLEFVREIGVNYPNLMGNYDAIGMVQDAGNPTGALPFTVVMDRQGRLVNAHLGRLNEVKLRAMIGKFL